MTMVSAPAALYQLPLFLQSLRGSELLLLDRTLVVTLDKEAQRLCHQVHSKRLCRLIETEGNENTRYLSNSDSNRHAYYQLGYVKIDLILEAVQLGHEVLFLDVDMIVLQDPFLHLPEATDVLVSRDKNTTTPEDPVNLGTIYFRPTNASIALLTAWSKTRGTWDQDALNSLLVPGSQAAEITSRLEFDKFASGCGEYCGDLIAHLLRRSDRWETVCPKHVIHGWVSFHVACAQAPVNWSPGNDWAMIKSDMMRAVYRAATSPPADSHKIMDNK